MTKPKLKACIAVAVVGFSLLAAMPVPAAAQADDGGMVAIDRWFSLAEGERTAVRLVRRVTDPSPDASADTQVLFGDGGSSGTMGVGLRQGGDTRDSRSLRIFAAGDMRDVQGRNCTTSNLGGMQSVSCERLGYNWRVDRSYHLAFVRGEQNEDGWLWTIRITDVSTNESTRLLSVRRPEARLTDRHLATAFMQTEDCTPINNFRTTARPARAQEDALTWRNADVWARDCENAQVRAPVVNDIVRFSIE